MDSLIKYMNENHGDRYLFKYSTPSDYIDALAKKKIHWPTKYDDMFPYADGPDAYWTGYFTSRPNDKEYIRRASSHFHASNLIYAERALALDVTDGEVEELLKARATMLDELGINQHHDAVTGTGK